MWRQILDSNPFWEIHCQAFLEAYPVPSCPMAEQVLKLTCSNWREQYKSMKEPWVVLGPYSLNVRTIPNMKGSKTLKPLGPSTVVYPLIKFNDSHGNIWFRHQTGWSMQEDVQSTNAAAGNTFGRFFIAQQAENKPHMPLQKDLSIYPKPTSTSAPCGTRNEKPMRPVAFYIDGEGTKWFRDNLGWSQSQFFKCS